MPTNVPQQQGISSPPLDGEGNSFVLTPQGKYVLKQNKKPINLGIYNQITKDGTDTRKLLEQDLETLLNTETSEEVRNVIRNLLPNRFDNYPGTALQEAEEIAANLSGNSRGASADPSLNIDADGTSRLFGQQLWNYRITLLNHEQPVYQLAPHAIKMLCIEDQLLNWPTQGYVIIDAQMEAFERSEIDEFFHIRSDGRCEIFIDIWPKFDHSHNPWSVTDMPDEIWRVTIHGIVYDVEDLAHENLTTKAKKLYFWDKNFQLMQETTVEWSTTQGKRFKSPAVPRPAAHATDNERSMYTGEAIASLLTEAGFEKIINFNNWDMGGCKICYTAKADWSVWDNIQYILKQHISSKGGINDICALSWNRAKELIELVPYSDLFEQAGSREPGKLQIEHLFFESRGNAGAARETDVPMKIGPWKAPYLNEASSTVDIKTGEYNLIRNYQFVQTSGIDSSKAYKSKPVYSHWHRQKQFDCDVEENEIKHIKERFFKPNYVDKLLGNYPVFVLNKTKTEQRAIEPIFSPISTIDPETDRLGRSVAGKGTTLYEGIYLNQCMVVRLAGSTHRLSGTFVGIDRLTENSDTDYDYQVCGQYLVASVKHLFRFQSYVTDLTLVKINAFDKLKNTNEGIV